MVKACDERALGDEHLRETFETMWPKLASKLEAIPPIGRETKEVTRSERSLLEEVLEAVRALQRNSDASIQSGAAEKATSRRRARYSVRISKPPDDEPWSRKRRAEVIQALATAIPIATMTEATDDERTLTIQGVGLLDGNVIDLIQRALREVGIEEGQAEIRTDSSSDAR